MRSWSAETSRACAVRPGLVQGHRYAGVAGEPCQRGEVVLDEDNGRRFAARPAALPTRSRRRHQRYPRHRAHALAQLDSSRSLGELGVVVVQEGGLPGADDVTGRGGPPVHLCVGVAFSAPHDRLDSGPGLVQGDDRGCEVGVGAAGRMTQDQLQGSP